MSFSLMFNNLKADNLWYESIMDCLLFCLEVF